MATFQYQALNAEKQFVSGELQAETVDEALAQLEGQGLTIQSLRYAPSENRSAADVRATDAFAARGVIEQKVLRAHLAKVIEGGNKIMPALKAFSEEVPPGRRRNELHALIRVLEQGSLEEAERAFAELPDYWIPLLSAAISSSDPGRILHQFIHETQRTDEIRRQWWLALAYPVLVSFIAGLVLILLSVFVIPVFREIFRDFDIKLPVLTEINLSVANFIAHTWPILALVFISVVGAIVYSRTRGRSRHSVTNGFLGLFGRMTAVAQLSQFMADLLEAGLSPVDTLKVAGFLTNRRRVRDSVWQLADHLERNPGVAIRLEPPARMSTVYHAIRGEMPTSSRIRLLRETSQAYAELAQHRMSWTRGLVEPATILLIGFIVGLVVVSLFLPLISLIDALSH